MPEFFGDSGQLSDVGVSSPNLDGIYLPGIDAPDASDGLGVVIPWGSGSTTRTYTDYGPSSGSSSSNTQLSDLASYMSSGGNEITYNLEGLVGPQGPAGPPGPQGTQGLPGTPYINSEFVTGLNETLDLIASTWETTETLLYADDIFVYWERTWQKLNVDSGVNAWNEIDLDEDGSFIIIAADDGIFVSTDSGDTWAEKNPDTEDFIAASCSASAGKAIVLGSESRSLGSIWVTSNYGVNWSTVTISVP